MSWGYLDIKDFHNRVRLALNIQDESKLTDELINSPEKANLAELQIKQLVPHWETILLEADNDKISMLESCVVIRTAEFFVGYTTSKRVKIVKTSAANVEYFDSEDDNKAEELSKLLNFYLGMLKEETSGKFFGFIVT